MVVLAFLGASRTHLHNFPLFLAVVLGLAVVIVAAFAATAHRESANDPNEPFLHH